MCEFHNQIKLLAHVANTTPGNRRAVDSVAAFCQRLRLPQPKSLEPWKSESHHTALADSGHFPCNLVDVRLPRTALRILIEEISQRASRKSVSSPAGRRRVRGSAADKRPLRFVEQSGLATACGVLARANSRGAVPAAGRRYLYVSGGRSERHSNCRDRGRENCAVSACSARREQAAYLGRWRSPGRRAQGLYEVRSDREATPPRPSRS